MLARWIVAVALLFCISGFSELNEPSYAEKLEESLAQSEDPIIEARKLIRAFLEEANAEYGLSLTFPDACRLVRENLPLLNLPSENEETFLATLTLLENETPAPFYKTIFPKIFLSPLFFLKFFGFGSSSERAFSSEGIPAEVLVGTIETIVGMALLGFPTGYAQVAGPVLISDGVRRIIDGAKTLDKVPPIQAETA